MLLTTIRDEFVFNCQCRKLSERTTKNYQKQITYLLTFLEQDKGVTEIEGVKPQFIKEFLMKMQQKGRTVNYFNDLSVLALLPCRYPHISVF